MEITKQPKKGNRKPPNNRKKKGENKETSKR